MIVLYIQMNLCQLNLRQWMDDRMVRSSPLEVENIAAQILSGLEFIHNQNCIHHDIKVYIFYYYDDIKFKIKSLH